jgi:hypothetical protein
VLVQNDRTAKNTAITAESALPEGISENGGTRTVGRVFFVGEVAAQHGLDVQHGKEVRRHVAAQDAISLLAPPESPVTARVGREA